LDLQNKSYELTGVYKLFTPFNFHFKTLYSTYDFTALLGSTHSKGSRDIKFSKFGLVDYFLWILQDLCRSSNLKIEFKPDLTGFD
jgi:hypothetical protein